MGGEEKEAPPEDSIRVICRVRPLNKSEEAAGSKFILSFPGGRTNDDINSISIGVSIQISIFVLTDKSKNPR